MVYFFHTRFEYALCDLIYVYVGVRIVLEVPSLIRKNLHVNGWLFLLLQRGSEELLSHGNGPAVNNGNSLNSHAGLVDNNNDAKKVSLTFFFRPLYFDALRFS